MLQAGRKRRRTHQEIVEQEAADLAEKAETKQKLEQYDALHQEYLRVSQIASDHALAKDLMEDLVSKRKIVIQDDGEVLVPGVDIISPRVSGK